MTPVVCILSGILGNRIVSRQLGKSVDQYLGEPADQIWFDDDTYRKYPAPRILRRFSVVESELVARRLLMGRRFTGAVVVNGYGLAQAAASRCAKLIVATDVTPRLINEVLADQRSLVRRAMGQIMDRRFRHLVARVDQWLPISGTCRNSLVSDYGVDPDRCHVTRSAQPVIHNTAVRNAPGNPRQLLFVGNDFARKGGFVLLEAFRQRLLSDCKLTVVSRDPALRGVEVQDVRIHQDISDPAGLSAAYLAADLLVLPTGADHYPNVICEALAHGLPFLATPVGAIPELLRESAAGLELPRKPDAEILAKYVRAAFESEEDHVRRSRAAIDFASRHLTLDAFGGAVHDALRAAGVDSPAR